MGAFTLSPGSGHSSSLCPTPMDQTDPTGPQQILPGRFSGPSPEVRTPEPPHPLLPTEPKGRGPMQEWLQWPASGAGLHSAHAVSGASPRIVLTFLPAKLDPLSKMTSRQGLGRAAPSPRHNPLSPYPIIGTALPLHLTWLFHSIPSQWPLPESESQGPA